MKNLILIGLMFAYTVNFATDKEKVKISTNVDLICTWDFTTTYVKGNKNCYSVIESYKFYSDKSCELIKTVYNNYNQVFQTAQQLLDWKIVGNNIVFFNEEGKQTKLAYCKNGTNGVLKGEKTAYKTRTTNNAQYSNMNDEIVYVQ